MDQYPSPFAEPPRDENTAGSDAAASTSRQPPSLIIPPTPPSHTSDSSPPDEDLGGEASARLGPLGPAAGGKRVQWPAELSHHHSIAMRSPSSPQTLQDQGAQDALTRALEEHSQHPDRPFPSRYMSSAPPSETPSRGESSDGDHEERLQDMRENMEVFVDPGETEGLPSVRKKGGGEAKSSKAAWNLVRAASMGSYGFMRQRKNAGFTSGRGENADVPEGSEKRDEETQVGEGHDDDDESQKREGGAAGFFKNLIHGDSVSEVPSRSAVPSGSGNLGGGAGVLSALMALQAQQQSQDPQSGANSVASNSPSASRAPSSRNSMDGEDSSDEESERIKFTERQRAKRQSKNAFHQTSSSIGEVGKHVGHSAAVALGFGHSHAHRRTQSGLNESPTPVTPGEPVVSGHAPTASTSSAKGTAPLSIFASRSSGHLPLEPPSPGLHSPRKKKGVFGETVQGFKKLGESLGLDHELTGSRPEAARSGAGVFGGLIASAGNIAGVASPAATRVAPQTDRPGYHLSRYSAPTVTQKALEAEKPRKSFDLSWSRPPSRPQSTYGGSDPGADAGTDSPRSATKSGSESAAGSLPGTPTGGLTPQLSAGSGGALLAKNKSSRPVSLNLKDLPHPSKFSFHLSRTGTSASGDDMSLGARKESHLGEYFGGHGKETQEERERREWEKEKKRRKKVKEKRKQDEIFITQHVAAILSRQDFLMKMGRAFMMFGAPSHRLEAQLQATARVLEINCQAIYLPGVLLISFGDVATHTSEIKFLKQANGLDLGKLLAAYYVYYNVIHDKISVTDASVELDDLMRAPPKYKLWQHLIIGGFASAFIQPSAFYGSFIDCLVSVPLGALLVLVQVVVSRNDLYSSLFDVIACINAFLAAALASTNHFCFAAVASGSVVLILPGYIVLCGSLELANRSIISGSVRLVYSILYSLFLGFGLAMGSEVYQRVTGLAIAGATDYTCASLRVDAPWYKAVIPPKWYIFTIPMYLLMLGLRNGQPLFRKETVVMLLVGSGGFAANFFGGKAFPNRADISSALGSFAVGFLGNIYGKFSRTTSPFVVMVVGVLIQLPSGLSNGGLLEFASDTTSSSSYSAGFSTAESLVEVAIGLTVGLFLAAAVVNIFGGGRRRGSNLSSF